MFFGGVTAPAGNLIIYIDSLVLQIQTVNVEAGLGKSPSGYVWLVVSLYSVAKGLLFHRSCRVVKICRRLLLPGRYMEVAMAERGEAAFASLSMPIDGERLRHRSFVHRSVRRQEHFIVFIDMGVVGVKDSRLFVGIVSCLCVRRSCLVRYNMEESMDK